MKTLVLICVLFLIGFFIINFISGFIGGVKSILAGEVPLPEQPPVSKKVVEEHDKDDSGSYCRICGNYSPDIDGFGECWSCAGDDRHIHHHRY